MSDNGPQVGQSPNGLRRALRFVHTSDVHLGAYDHSDQERSVKRRGEMHATFEAVIDLTISSNSDFMVIAGDFFDNARVREETMRFAAEQLARLECPVVIAPGNHDHVGPNSVYDRRDLSATAQNVTVVRSLEGATVALDGLDGGTRGCAVVTPAQRFGAGGKLVFNRFRHEMELFDTVFDYPGQRPAIWRPDGTGHVHRGRALCGPGETGKQPAQPGGAQEGSS